MLTMPTRWSIATHRALLQAEVDASLHVFDGLGHCFLYDATAQRAPRRALHVLGARSSLLNQEVFSWETRANQY
jgi:hypothetical protein